MFRKLRIGVLLYVLILVAASAWFTKVRSTDWSDPLWVLVYPINGDASKASDAYIRHLDRATFEPVAEFMQSQAARYGITQRHPVSINIARPIDRHPPLPPAGSNPIAVGWWSLRLRCWAWQVERAQSDPPAQVQIFVLYHDPEITGSVPHSLGLQKGLIGVVHAFAARRMTATNNVIIAHELFHTLGATDKYDPATNQPEFPDGFAEPNRDPLYPQRRAELMAGRIALGEHRFEIPRSLHQVVVGPASAEEINWR